MNVEIICVGTELLLGDILNTNAKFLSERMAELGFNLFTQSVVGDNPARLEKQIALSLSRSEIVILCGGLGPTEDDITKEITAKVLGLPLVMHGESLKRIENYFAATGRVMSENNRKQALTLSGATVLENNHGTAPGYFIKNSKGAVILLPGPPKELVPMFNEQVVPLLSPYVKGTIVSHNIRIMGVGESAAAEICGELLKNENPTVATYAKTGEVDIRVTASAASVKRADELSAPVIEKIKELFGSHVYGVDVDNLQQSVVNLLKNKKMKLATAESCTAGMLSEKITEVPGSSEVFEMGVTAYANYIKVQALGVDSELIERKGAVCEEVAAQMAVGIRTMCNADIGVGITGVAGPGESEGKPAGLVYISIADKEKVFVRKILGRGNDRDTIRDLATSTALDMVRRYIEGCSDLHSFGTVIGQPINLMEGYIQPQNKYASPKNEAPQEIKPKRIYTDEEIRKMFTTEDEDILSLRPEKLNMRDNSVDFIFEDDGYSEDPYVAAQDELANMIMTDSELEEEENIYTANADKKANDAKPVSKKKGFFANLFPSKNDAPSERVRKIAFLVAFLVMLGTLGYLLNYFVEGWLQKSEIDSAANVWEADNSMEKNAQGIFIGFESLIEQNNHIKGWIKIDGTNINNPVYQVNNNDYYINHDMNRQSSRYGALFIDKDSRIGREENTQNVIIYGHHMRDGSMFADLKNYTNLSFYKEHSVIDFTSLYREGKYKVFSVFITNDLLEHDNGYRFNYRHSTFASEEDFLDFIHQVKQRSIIDTGVEVFGDDEIITLSTCTYEFDDARLVVMARRIREGETDIYNTNSAKTNPNPLYPQIWYDMKGGKKPVSTSRPAVSVVSSEELNSEEPVSSENSSSTPTTSTGATPSTPKKPQVTKPNNKTETSPKPTTSSSAPSSSTAVNSTDSKPDGADDLNPPSDN